jgi:hypothetical protein
MIAWVKRIVRRRSKPQTTLITALDERLTKLEQRVTTIENNGNEKK